MYLFKLLCDCWTTLYNGNSLSRITIIHKEYFLIKKRKQQKPRDLVMLMSRTHSFMYILWFRGVLQSATGHWSHQKFIYSQSLLESFRTKSQSKQSAVCRGPVDEEANDQPFNRTHGCIWNNKPAPITRMKTLRIFFFNEKHLDHQFVFFPSDMYIFFIL